MTASRTKGPLKWFVLYYSLPSSLLHGDSAATVMVYNIHSRAACNTLAGGSGRVEVLVESPPQS